MACTIPPRALSLSAAYDDDSLGPLSDDGLTVDLLQDKSQGHLEVTGSFGASPGSSPALRTNSNDSENHNINNNNSNHSSPGSSELLSGKNLSFSPEQVKHIFQ